MSNFGLTFALSERTCMEDEKTPNLIALPITSPDLGLFEVKEVDNKLGRGDFLSPTKIGHNNKGRFCNTIASVALVHTSIQSD